jgi:basic membrane lipoprotein Med (substrate-binding protein (PBP1-ABC) superfamily)/ABC-type phosphate/phosphonate transport system substrate-binding protein
MHDLIGQTLGQYRIIEQLGKGGMATVFKGFQPSLERYVAIKVLPPYFAHEEGFSERFDREAKAIARLEHPHILPIYDHGQDREVSYIAMKYVDAGTLKDIEAGGPMSPEQALEIISQTAEALDYAHNLGIIHRDIKPANILMDRGSWVLLTDFGLAKMVEGSQQLTASGVGVGTPAYMAPEQGQGRPVDGRADIYSLGIVLYEMLTGCVPYEAETPLAVVLKHVTEPLKMPRLVNPSIPEAVELVILKALAKEPDDRYQTVGEMATALRNAIEDAQLLGQTDTAWPAPSESAFAEPVVTVKAPAEHVKPAPLPSDVTTAPEIVPEPAPDIAQVPTEVLADVAPVAVAEVAPQEPAVEAPLPEPEPEPVAAIAEARPRPAKRPIPWWAFAVGGVLLVALIAVGIGFAVDWFGGEAYPEETIVAEMPTKPPPGDQPPGGQPGQGDAVLLGVLDRPDSDTGNAAKDLQAYLIEELDCPVEVLVYGDPSALPQMLRDGAINAVALSSPQFLWLVESEGLPLKPILTLPPMFGAELYVRDDGAVENVNHLRGRPIALISWNDWAGILGLAALMDEGLNAREECEIIYLAPNFEAELRAMPLELVIRGEADAAIVSSGTVEQVEGDMPDVEGLILLGESEWMAYGVVAVMPGLPEEQVWELHDAIADVDPELTRALSPYGEVSSFDEPLLENFARALSMVGIEPWRLVENAPPEQGPRPEPPPPEPGVKRPQPGAQLEGNHLLMPIMGAVERAAEEYGFEVALVGVPEDAGSLDVAHHHVDEGFNVIVAVAWPQPEEVWGLAEARPEATFLAFGVPPHDPMPNVASFTYRMGEVGFLAGALAGKVTESGVVGVAAGPPIGAIEQLLGGFEKGLRQTCPDCGLIVRELVAEGADVVFSAAGGTGSAAIRAAAEEGAWVIGVDWDEFQSTFQEGRVPRADRLLGSIVVRTDKLAHKALVGLAEGRFEPGTHTIGIAEEGIEFIPSPQSAYPLQDELNRYLKELITAVREGRTRP